MSLNQAQSRAVAHLKGPCMVVAGPGSGKTFTILKRIQYLIEMGVSPDKILVITFSKNAVKELKDRFFQLEEGNCTNVVFGTFHSIYFFILKSFYGWKEDCILGEDERVRLIYEASVESGWKREGTREGTIWEKREEIKGLMEQIDLYDSGAKSLSSKKKSGVPEEIFQKIYKNFVRKKRNLEKVDFNDMIRGCHYLLEKRKDVREVWKNRFEYILVDEFQDINLEQYETLKLLLGKMQNLFVVGDDDQSIYGFRGAKPQIMEGFFRDFPKAKEIHLSENYRCSRFIFQSAQNLIRHNRNRIPKQLFSKQKSVHFVHIQETKDIEDEAEYIGKEILKWKSFGKEWNKIGVLYRNFRLGTRVATILEKKRIPICMKERGKSPYFYFIGQDIKSYFLIALKRGRRQEFLRVCNRPNRYIERSSLYQEVPRFLELLEYYKEKEWMEGRIKKFQQDMLYMRGQTPYAAIEYLKRGVGYGRFLEEYGEKNGIDLEELLDVFEEIQEESKELKTLEEWLELSEQGRGATLEHPEGVQVMTMHASKGLEFDLVFLIRANAEVIPSPRIGTLFDIEEERRLFYVAMTRAREKLVITYIKEKNGREQFPSRFVQEIWEQRNQCSSISSNSSESSH